VRSAGRRIGRGSWNSSQMLQVIEVLKSGTEN
jgi:hypothetical protein